MASYSLLLPPQQLGRTAVRRLENCHWLPQAHPMASRFNRAVANGSWLPIVARKRY
jgi:hypothetical protein